MHRSEFAFPAFYSAYVREVLVNIRQIEDTDKMVVRSKASNLEYRH